MELGSQNSLFKDKKISFYFLKLNVASRIFSQSFYQGFYFLPLRCVLKTMKSQYYLSPLQYVYISISVFLSIYLHLYLHLYLQLYLYVYI